MDVERATTADVDVVTEQWVALAAEQRDHDSHIRPEANEAHIRDAIAHHAATGRLLVAREDAVVGFAMVAIERGTFQRDVERGVLEAIYVVPERRDEGIGSALVAAAEQELRERGATVFSLEALAANDAARRFYRRHGFSTHRVEFEKPLETDTHSKEEG